MSIRIVKDAPLCDGTPRKERGYRAFVDGPRNHNTGRRVIYRSAIFKTEAGAQEWAHETFQRAHFGERNA